MWLTRRDKKSNRTPFCTIQTPHCNVRGRRDASETRDMVGVFASLRDGWAVPHKGTTPERKVHNKPTRRDGKSPTWQAIAEAVESAWGLRLVR